MWADTLLRAEQQHLLRLLVWAALSTLGGSCVVVMITVRRVRSPLLAHFSTQLVIWGVTLAGIAAIEWRGLHLRDVAGAARLEHLVWMNVGFDAGFIGMAAVLALSGRVFARSAAASGAAAGIAIQGIALLIIDLQFAASISR